MGSSRQEFWSGLPFQLQKLLSPASEVLESSSFTRRDGHFYFLKYPCAQANRLQGGTGQCRNCRSPEFNPQARNVPWRRESQPTPVFLPEESHGQKSLEGYSSWGCKESVTTEHAHLPRPITICLLVSKSLYL